VAPPWPSTLRVMNAVMTIDTTTAASTLRHFVCVFSSALYRELAQSFNTSI
jgi:hypothetical protein